VGRRNSRETGEVTSRCGARARHLAPGSLSLITTETTTTTTTTTRPLVVRRVPTLGRRRRITYQERRLDSPTLRDTEPVNITASV